MENTEIVEYVSNNIIGRLANKIGNRKTDNTEVLLSYVEKANGGNHLEIGTLFGGSAICVALLKKELGHSGLVFCIDPLDGYYTKDNGHGLDISGEKVVPSTLFENIQKFDVGDRILVMQSGSVPCPGFIDMEFSTAYIDGDHKNGVPLKDWNCIKNFVTRYIIFDNRTHNDVKLACKIAAREWRCVYDKDITYVVER